MNKPPTFYGHFRKGGSTYVRKRQRKSLVFIPCSKSEGIGRGGGSKKHLLFRQYLQKVLFLPCTYLNLACHPPQSLDTLLHTPTVKINELILILKSFNTFFNYKSLIAQNDEVSICYFNGWLNKNVRIDELLNE